MFCRSCGKEIPEGTKFCPYCGASQNGVSSTNANDTGSFGWAVLGFFIPLAGLILYLVWKDTQPKNANQAGKGALTMVILNAVLIVVYFVCIAGLVGCAATA